MNIGSCHLEVFCEKCVLKNFAKFTEKHLCQSLFLIMLKASTLLKKRLWHRCFIWILLNKNTFFIEHIRWLFLNKFLFELSSVISSVFVAVFEHVFVCWRRYRITIFVLQIIEKPHPANKSLLKVKNRTLKQDAKSVKSWQ